MGRSFCRINMFTLLPSPRVTLKLGTCDTPLLGLKGAPTPWSSQYRHNHSSAYPPHRYAAAQPGEPAPGATVSAVRGRALSAPVSRPRPVRRRRRPTRKPHAARRYRPRSARGSGQPAGSTGYSGEAGGARSGPRPLGPRLPAGSPASADWRRYDRWLAWDGPRTAPTTAALGSSHDCHVE